MIRPLINLLICMICEPLALVVIYNFILGERDNIIEVGYRSQSKKYKKLSKKLPLWDRVLHWNLCKEAKIKTKAVWIYFSLNLFLVVAAIVSIVYASILVILYEYKEVLLNLLKYYMFVFLVWGIAHFILDLLFLPSEQRRYGINSKKNNKK